MVDKLKTVDFPKGDVNYIISMIIGSAYLHKPSYDTLNDMEGALNHCLKEYFRRVGFPHESLKVDENGDIEVYEQIDSLIVKKRFDSLIRVVKKKNKKIK